jgi:hypothetical protein
MIDSCLIQEYKEEAYILYFQRYDKASLSIEVLKPMVKLCNKMKCSSLISNIPLTYREMFLTCLKSEAESFLDYTYLAEIAKLWDMNSNLHDLVKWDIPLTFFGLAGGLSDTFLTNHKTEIYKVCSYFLTHFYGEQNKVIFREFMINLKGVVDPVFYDELVHYINVEFEGRTDVLKPMDMSGLSIEFFKQ